MAPHEIPHIGFVELVGGGVVQALRHRLSGEEVAALAADGVDQWLLAYNEEGNAFLHRPGIAVWAKDFLKREPCWRMEARSSSSNMAWKRVLLPTVAQRTIMYLCLGRCTVGGRPTSRCMWMASLQLDQRSHGWRCIVMNAIVIDLLFSNII